jgi:hypothetical protein
MKIIIFQAVCKMFLMVCDTSVVQWLVCAPQVGKHNHIDGAMVSVRTSSGEAQPHRWCND